MDASSFIFPIGYHQFHEDQVFNFQLNRWHSLGYARFEDMEEAGKSINTFDDWKTEMLKLADKALYEERFLNAAFYYRAAEFYTFSDDPDKEQLYNKFIDLFYKVFADDEIERSEVPYEKAFLPVMKIRTYQGIKKGTIVMHGGFDSFIQEFYSMMRYFAENGYDVIAFEGPGQGGARIKNDLALDYEWEKPARAILDYFKLDDVIWFGISMGGWLCFRAAAFEPRIKRVMASSIAYDYLQFIGPVNVFLVKILFKYFKNFINNSAYRKMKRDRMHRWSINQALDMTKTDTPIKAMEFMFLMNAENLHSEQVKQDVLILTGRNDHFIPFKMHGMQVKALINARSVNARIFEKESNAQNHCQVGNIGLALETMLEWLNKKI